MNTQRPPESEVLLRESISGYVGQIQRHSRGNYFSPAIEIAMFFHPNYTYETAMAASSHQQQESTNKHFSHDQGMSVGSFNDPSDRAKTRATSTRLQ